ncbi:MAG: flagellar motor protein MotB [Desulfitobacteriaceae bacterium]
MGRKKVVEAEKENGERWLLTYADLITLLMIFFVVLYSMSNVDAMKFRAVADSLNKALGGGTPAKIEISTELTGPGVIPQYAKKPASDSTETTPDKKTGSGNANQENMTIDEIKKNLDKYAAENSIQTKLISSIEERGLVISIKDTLLFDSGSAVITPKALEILNKICKVLSIAGNYIKIEGHTDNVPINTFQFPSNWELSVIRATNVLQRMAGEGGITPDRLSAIGYGEYRPIDSNTNDSGRAKNRRVDLVILRTIYDVTEPSKKLVIIP